jgi:hypothetical protein
LKETAAAAVEWVDRPARVEAEGEAVRSAGKVVAGAEVACSGEEVGTAARVVGNVAAIVDGIDAGAVAGALAGCAPAAVATTPPMSPRAGNRRPLRHAGHFINACSTDDII